MGVAILAVSLLVAIAYLLVFPRAVGRLVTSGARTLVLLHASWLLVAYFAVLALVAGLAVRLMPHQVMTFLGIACVSRQGCVLGIPTWLQTGIWSLATAALLALVTGTVVLTVRQVLRSVKLRRLVLAQGQRRTGHRYLPQRSTRRLLWHAVPQVALDDPAPLACTIGFLRPVVVVSTGLASRLEGAELEAVLAHEQAHASHMDNLILLVARICSSTLFFLPGVRSAHAALRRFVELSADQTARRWLGSGLTVAASLQRVAVVMTGHGSQGSPRGPFPGAAPASFADSEIIAERIHNLLQDDIPAAPRRRVAVVVLSLVVLLAAFATAGLRLADVNWAAQAHVPGCETLHSGSDIS